MYFLFPLDPIIVREYIHKDVLCVIRTNCQTIAVLCSISYYYMQIRYKITIQWRSSRMRLGDTMKSGCTIGTNLSRSNYTVVRSADDQCSRYLCAKK